MWYVGKSVDVRKRHVQHMHDCRHEVPPRIPEQMLWAQVAGDEKQLDFAETEAISRFESEGYSLTNTMKTGRPKGNTEVIVDTGAGWGVPIPWERENLLHNKRKFAFEPNEGKRKRLSKLEEIDCYEQPIEILALYVSNTIPAPADTAGTPWTATALPTTHSNGRLCTISRQNAEAFVVFKGDAIYPDSWGFVNVKKPEGAWLPLWRKCSKTDYGTLPNVVRLEFHTLDEGKRLLQNDKTLDACYRANAELMRKGASMHRRYTNPYLMQAILERL